MPPDFLDSREDAILFSGAALLVFALSKNPMGIGASFLAVGRSLLGWKLLTLFGSALLYTAVLVFAASKLGLWHTTALKATVFWFIGTAVVLAGNAVARRPGEPNHVAAVARRVFAVTLAVDLLLNLYVFPLAVELVGVFILVAFAGMHVVAAHDPSIDSTTRRVIDVVLAAVVLLYLAYSLLRAATDLGGTFTQARAEELLVGPTLTLLLIPFLLLAAWVSRKEQERLKARFRARNTDRNPLL